MQLANRRTGLKLWRWRYLRLGSLRFVAVSRTCICSIIQGTLAHIKFTKRGYEPNELGSKFRYSHLSAESNILKYSNLSRLINFTESVRILIIYIACFLMDIEVTYNIISDSIYNI
jgi:hypothetical protein